MKFIFTLTIFLLGFSDSSFAWNAKYVCDNQQFVIDVMPTSGSGVQGQMVLRGSYVETLYKLGVVQSSELNQKGEIVALTNYDERGYLNLAANINADTCIKFYPKGEMIQILKNAKGYCEQGTLLQTVYFQDCDTLN